MLSAVVNANMPRPRRLTLQEIEKGLQQATMLGAEYARPTLEIRDVRDRYTKEADRVTGGWSDNTLWETAPLYCRIANQKHPGAMPGAGLPPSSNSNWRLYYPKSKCDFIAVMDITPEQGWHLSFGHELMHVSKVGWNMLFDYTGFLSLFICIAMLTVSIIVNRGEIGYFAIYLFIAGLAYETWRSLPISGNRDREEASAEIGAAILATEAGVTSGFTDYSAAYVSRYLRRFTPKYRAKYVKLAYKRGTARVDFVMRQISHT